MPGAFFFFFVFLLLFPSKILNPQLRPHIPFSTLMELRRLFVRSPLLDMGNPGNIMEFSFPDCGFKGAKLDSACYITLIIVDYIVLANNTAQCGYLWIAPFLAPALLWAPLFPP